METVEQDFDDCEFDPVINTESANVAFSLGELDVQKLSLISGGVSSASYTLGTPVTIGPTAYETITLHGNRPVRLAHKSFSTTAPVEVSTLVVKENTDTTPTTYVKDTDYSVDTDILGYTTITRKGTTIEDGETVRVTYGYTPAAMKTLSRGGKNQVSPIVIRVLHVKRIEGEKIFGYMIDLFKVYFTKSGKLSFGSDKDLKAPHLIPYEFTGKYDKNRTLGKQIDAISVFDKSGGGVTLAQLNMDLMADLDLAVLKEAAVTA